MRTLVGIAVAFANECMARKSPTARDGNVSQNGYGPSSVPSGPATLGGGRGGEGKGRKREEGGEGKGAEGMGTGGEGGEGGPREGN